MTVESIPDLVFASPRKLPRAGSLRGRVVVVDIAFAADGLGRGFARTTGKFIEQLGSRLARWVDHHDHERHSEFAADPRFVLCTKAEHGACPEMITPQMVQETGPIDTIVAHFDLDGLYAAAKWILGGHEPYAGADEDARAVDTRVGAVSPKADLIDRALRAHYNDVVLKTRIVHYLIEGLRPGGELEAIEAAAADQDRMVEEAQRLAAGYHVDGDIAMVTIPAKHRPFDKTELLLIGQRRATVAIVTEEGNTTIAAPFHSGLNFVELLDLGGGMPTRVNVPESRLPLALARISATLAARASDSAARDRSDRDD
ncbi:MAG: hypothetical protein B7733_00970 [Myxococcales bacterium FL481]|nr:MAG: hypothetical protein B7733_00970 [Myxococcales bacterium FL481]